MFKIKDKVVYSLGLMSGTSLDGVDIAYCRHENNKHELIHFKSYPYSNDLKERILKASVPSTSTVEDICSLHAELGDVYSDCIDQFLKDFNLSIEDIYFISNHGQTIWHIPNETNTHKKSTLQIGDASRISYRFNKIVVYDFRTLDMASGGVGAPLVPIFDYIYYKEHAPIILLNIGGISNITYIPKNAKPSDLVAFDTGPGNMLIDGTMERLYDMPFDEGGNIAKKGMVSKQLLDYLFNDEYYDAPYPKATGREKYTNKFIEEILNYANTLKLEKEDIISTITYFTSFVVKYQIKKFFKGFNGKLLVSGGGANNKYIVDNLEDEDYQVILSEDLDVPSDAKEAFAFSVLGYLRLTNQTSNVKSVTGAKDNLSLGSIILPSIINEE